jgi:hypothetical protein
MPVLYQFMGRTKIRTRRKREEEEKKVNCAVPRHELIVFLI